MRTIVRMASPEFDQLRRLVFSRYPRFEWGTFARFGWRNSDESLVLTLASLDMPQRDDLDDRLAHVVIQERYTLRIALQAEAHSLAVGVIHSHPRNCIPRASDIDDDMDTYYASYFADFAPDRPYVSLIFSELDGVLSLSGRIYYKNTWRMVDHFSCECTPVDTWFDGHPPEPLQGRERIKRLSAAFGNEADERLRRSTVAVIGAGGTGSAAIEILARSGVGHLIVVDPDCVEESNLERLHGSNPSDAENRVPKALLARRHVQSIDPTCVVTSLMGALPQASIVDAVITADVALGCTDKQHSRLALSDLAVRYLLPAIDCGVTLEGAAGHLTGQVLQLIRFLAADACALCRQMIHPQRLQHELASAEERHQRRAAAAAAIVRGESPDPYWRDEPQLNTVGYLTTIAGSLAAGYAIGWLTGRYAPPFERLQMNLVAPFFDVTDAPIFSREDCPCRRIRGWADQAAADAFISAPPHWAPPRAF